MFLKKNECVTGLLFAHHYLYSDVELNLNYLYNYV